MQSKARRRLWVRCRSPETPEIEKAQVLACNTHTLRVVRYSVCLEVATLTEGHRALSALVWFLPSVGSHVYLEVLRLSTHVVTLITFVRLFPSVGSHVHFEVLI